MTLDHIPLVILLSISCLLDAQPLISKTDYLTGLLNPFECFHTELTTKVKR